ncbi:hypothetical protein C2E23DRAFT_717737, partial [Lenzites betulinus]
MSCLLFILAIEPLAIALRASPLRGINVPGVSARLITTLYADDTTVFLHCSDDYDTLTELLRVWCAGARAKFNAGKTEAIPLGPSACRAQLVRDRTACGWALAIPPSVRIVPDGDTIRVLGARVGNDADQCAAWRPIVAKIRANLARWGRRKPTLYGRKLIVGLEVGSRTQFLAAAQGMPATIEHELQRIIIEFIWNSGGHHHVASQTLMEPVAKGGL